MIFEAKNLYIKNKSDKMVMANFSFSVNKGEIWMIKGPNGIGKTSIYEALIGLISLKKGKLFLNNQNITSLPANLKVRSGMKYIAQTNALFYDISVKDNLRMVAESLLPSSEQEAAIEKAKNIFEIGNFMNFTPSQLSGGQQRRVELSKIVIGPADFILLDEPFAAIDGKKTEALCKIFKNLAKNENKAFLINDHNLQAVERIADFCIDLTEGAKITTIQQDKHYTKEETIKNSYQFIEKLESPT